MEFWALLFRFRNEMFGKFLGKSRRRWFDAEDAFSEITTEVYQEALKGDLQAPSERDDWVAFLFLRMRKRIWEKRRKDKRTLTADAGQEALSQIEASDKDDPVKSLEAREELEKLVPQVKSLLSPKQEVVFFATAQELSPEEVARAAQTTPSAARVHLSKAEEKLNKELRPKLKARVA